MVWGTAGQATEARSWLERILAMAGEDVRAIDRAEVLAGASVLALGQGELEAAHRYVNRASENESELQFHARYRALLLYVRGSLAQRAGDWNTALDFLRSGLDLAGGTPDGAPVAALCCQQPAEASVVRGDMSGAQDWAARALELSSTLGFPQGRGLALLTLGTLSHQLGDLTAAQDYLEASAAVGREFGQGGRRTGSRPKPPLGQPWCRRRGWRDVSADCWPLPRVQSGCAMGLWSHSPWHGQ
jgi:tetratricopeptide (TPR) repeat protein